MFTPSICTSKTPFYHIVKVHVTDSPVHFMGCVPLFKHINRWVFLSSLQLCLFLLTWSGFPLGGTCQFQCPGPLAWHLAEGQLGQENPQSTGLYRLPLQRPVTEKHYLFLETKATHEQGWHVDRKGETRTARQLNFPGCSALIGHSSRVRPVCRYIEL